MLLTSLLVAGVAGVVGGFFFRVPALIFATAVVIAIAALPFLAGQMSRVEVLFSILLHVAVLQAAYLSALLFASFRAHRPRSRPAAFPSGGFIGPHHRADRPEQDRQVAPE